MKKNFYITTPIYYPSASLHIGHAYCSTLTDSIARYKRMRGFNVYFLTGADEHGEKIEKNALKANLTPQAFVDEIVGRIKELWARMKISNDDFLRTTESRHTEVVQLIFSELLKKGLIYKGNYSGWYCTPCESFWTDTQVTENHICPDCGREVHSANEEAYFLKTSEFGQFLLDFYAEHPTFITPASRINEMINSFIKPGLEDLCVTRTSFSWGIPVKEDPRHVIYVWIDALTNYITALGYLSDDDSKFKEFWSDETEIVHIVGNDITRFHTIYWPIILKALGLREPDKIFVHGLMMMKDGVKMSKSRGNVVAPEPLIERYGLDTVRYYLCREVIFGQDGTFTPEQFVERANADLANNLGNLVNRTVSMIVKYYDGVIPQKAVVSENTKELELAFDGMITKYEAAFDDLLVTDAVIEVMNYLSKANKYIEVQAPWALAKDEAQAEELKATMVTLAEVIFRAAILLSPIIVETPEKILHSLGLQNDDLKYENLRHLEILAGKTVSKDDQLFPRLDKVVEMEYIKSLMN